MLLGTLVAGPSLNHVGRKWTYILGVSGSLGCGYALIAAAQNRWMLYLGRFLHGKYIGYEKTEKRKYTTLNVNQSHFHYLRKWSWNCNNSRNSLYDGNCYAQSKRAIGSTSRHRYVVERKANA